MFKGEGRWQRRLLAMALLLCMLCTGMIASADQQEIRKSIVRVYGRVTADANEVASTNAALATNGISGTVRNYTAWTGSATAIGKPGESVEYFLTNKHCVSQVGWEEDFPVFDSSGNKLGSVPLTVASVDLQIIYDTDANAVPAFLAGYHDYADLAVLKLNTKQNFRVPAVFRPFEGNEVVSQKVWTCGFPGAADVYQADGSIIVGDSDSATMSSGEIGRILDHSMTNEGQLIQFDASINGGNSGGALVDANGYLLGVPTYGLSSAQNTNAAVSVNEAIRMLDQYGIPYTTVKDIQKFPWLWVILGVVAVAIIVILILVLRKKDKKNKKDQKQPNETVQKPVTPSVEKRYIVCEDGPLAGKRYEIRDKLVIGRDGDNCQIVFPENDTRISRVHCEVRYRHGNVTVTDLSSTGTTIDGKPLNKGEAVTWHRGHRLTIGNAYSFKLTAHDK